VVIGILSVRAVLRGNRSLKEKRRIVRGLVERTASRFNLSVAEVADQDLHQTALLGIACVSNSPSHVDAMLDKAVAFMASSHPEAEISPVDREIIHW